MGKGGNSLSLAAAMQAAAANKAETRKQVPGAALRRSSSANAAEVAAQARIASSGYTMRSKTPNATARIRRAAQEALIRHS